MIKKIGLLILFVISNNVLIAQSEVQSYKDGDFRIDIKLPHINYLSFNPNKEFRDSEIGFNGYGLAFEYNYKENKFFEVGSSIVTTFELPFPAPVDSEYNKILYSFYFNLTDNFIKNRFTFGYGLNYSANTWKEWTRNFNEINLPTTYSKTIVNKNLGLTLNSYYRFSKTMNLGLIYQPSLLNFNSNTQFIYEHSISLEVNWRIKFFNTHKKK